MRKVFLGVLAAVIMLSAGTDTAFAAGPRGGRCFVDADGDGICDYAGSVYVCVDADGDGICDVCGANYGSCLTGEGTAFADADGDGICDNCGLYHWCGMGGGNYIDADGDGVCDNYVSGQFRGRGWGCGFRCGRCR